MKKTAIEALLTPEVVGKIWEGFHPIRFPCHGCGKSVTSPLPSDAIMRAIAWCPECILTGKDQTFQATREDVKLLHYFAGDDQTDTIRSDKLFNLANRIEAALPSRE